MASADPYSPHLRHSEGDLLDLARHAVALAEKKGLVAAASVNESGGITATARNGLAETITGDQVQGITVTVWNGLRQGQASSGTLTRAAVESIVDHAAALARHGGEDADGRLADAGSFAVEDRPVRLFATAGWNRDDLLRQAIEVEAGAHDLGRPIALEAAGAAAHDHRVALANSHGFAGAYSSSTAGRWCVTAVGEEGMRRIGHSQDSRRRADALRSPHAIGRDAAERGAASLDPRTLSNRTCPVLIENRIAGELIGALTSALSGRAQFDGATFLAEPIGRQVAAAHLTLREEPLLDWGMSSRPFDAQGVAGTPRAILEDGVAKGLFLDVRYARKLQRTSTGNASGPHNLILDSSGTQDDDDMSGMLRKLGTGLFITQFSGQGVNAVTGDISRAASGFWVEGGVIAYSVEGFTVAGNLRDMLIGIVAVGADRIDQGGLSSGSILIDRLQVAGA